MTDVTLQGTLSEILQHHAEMIGHRLTVTIHQEADGEDYATDPIGIRDESQIEQLLLDGLASGMEDMPASEWSDLHKELHARLAENN